MTNEKIEYVELMFDPDCFADRAFLEIKAKMDALESENARLRKALNFLANEASGFLHCANAVQHGVTNMRVFQLRIDEARAALEGKQE